MLTEESHDDLGGPSPASEDSHMEDQEIELGNIPQSYEVPTTPHTRIHKETQLSIRVNGDLQETKKSFSMLLEIQHGRQQCRRNFFIQHCKRFESASYSNNLEKPLVQDGDADDVDEHLYRSMIGSLMYLTTSRPDIMFAVCVCARFQVSPKSSHLLHVKRIFRYLKVKPSLSLWYSKDSPLELVAYTNSDCAGATQDRKSTTGGCQFLGNRLISWQCKKQTVVATSTTEAEYVAAASCCGQYYRIIENHVQHNLNKNIRLRPQFKENCNAKTLIQIVKIDTEHNVADLLTKGFDAGRFQYLVSSIGMRSAEVTTAKNGEVKITATILMSLMTITEGIFKMTSQLDDQSMGLSSIPNLEIFEQLALMGYHTDSDKLTFQKGAFSPQWRFLIHSILHCLSPKKTAWEQFSSNIATAVICLATNRKYNFSRMIFEHMVSNISSPHKFLMYPRFIQICLDMQRNQLQQHSRTYHVPSLSMKVFNNMKRPTKGFSGQEVALFPTMLDVTEPSTSPSRITSSPSHSPEHSPSPTHSPSPAPSPTPEHITAAPTQPSPTQPSHRAEHHLLTPNESPIHLDDLKTTKQTYNTAFTKLILRVKKLEAQVKIGKVMRRARIVQSDDEDIADDSSKQGRILSDAEVQEKASNETEPVIQDVTPTEVRIYQKSQENSQKRANTDTGNGRAQEKPKIQSQSQKKSGKTLEGPSTPLVPTPVVSIPPKEPEQNSETSTEKVQNPNLENTAHVPPPEEEDFIFIEIPKPKAKKTVNVEIQEPNSPKPMSYQPKLPYPERMKIGLKDALVQMPKFNKWLSSLLRNKEKLEEIAITTVNAECSAIIMNKVPEKLKDPRKFLIPCALQELDRTSALADSGASINLYPILTTSNLGLKL
ncbi:hypothetical protein Tco_0242227 [Tanacetum coccineum]